MNRLSDKDQKIAQRLTHYMDQRLKECYLTSEIPYNITHDLKGDGRHPEHMKVYGVVLDSLSKDFPNIRMDENGNFVNRAPDTQLVGTQRAWSYNPTGLIVSAIGMMILMFIPIFVIIFLIVYVF